MTTIKPELYLSASLFPLMAGSAAGATVTSSMLGR
jgi:hypothetical protein